MNDRRILDICLGRSNGIVSGEAKLRIYEDFNSAGAAYNQALSDSGADYVVLVHQDVYLPRPFLSRLDDQVRRLNDLDPEWAVAGIIGLDENGALSGRTWSSGLGQLVGRETDQPKIATALDEVLLVIRRAASIEFDDNLPSFHLYATDLVQIAKQRGLGCYVIDAPVIHHSRPVVSLAGGYMAAYHYLQDKWRGQLPLPNLICPILSSSIPLHWRNFRMRLRHLGKTVRAEPTGDPAMIAQRLGLEDAP
ncbi:glycosyltransferase [Phenylobacterium sp.]|uniref:glycosyltransferase n=1 Tax=Phenylobacterium sp. TaxID=1871053 RepID=UPI002730E448|nr:glycosyltransferase [Phenylobacterium sp.]MDP1598230.1 hypothetical protein [Phenylobacterium sp.]MDP3594706.1 hypothetical protein [Phenylobacterium sp.]